MVEEKDRVILKQTEKESNPVNGLKVAEKIGEQIGTVAANIITDLPSAPKALVSNFGVVKNVVANAQQLGGKKAAAILLNLRRKARENEIDRMERLQENQSRQKGKDFLVDDDKFEQRYDELIYKIQNDSQAVQNLKEEYVEIENKNLDMISNMDNHVVRYGSTLAAGMVEGISDPVNMAENMIIGAAATATGGGAIAALGLTGKAAAATNIAIRYGGDAAGNMIQLKRDVDLLKDRDVTQDEQVMAFVNGLAVRAAMDGTKYMLGRGLNITSNKFLDEKVNPNNNGGDKFKMTSQKEMAKLAKDLNENIPNATNRDLFYRGNVDQQTYNPALDPRNPRGTYSDVIGDLELASRKDTIYQRNYYDQPVEIPVKSSPEMKALQQQLKTGQIDMDTYNLRSQEVMNGYKELSSGELFTPNIKPKQVDVLGKALEEFSSPIVKPFSKSEISTSDGMNYRILKKTDGTINVIAYNNNAPTVDPKSKSYVELSIQRDLDNSIIYNYDPKTKNQIPITGTKKFDVINTMKKSDVLDDIQKTMIVASNRLRQIKKETGLILNEDAKLPVFAQDLVNEEAKFLIQKSMRYSNELIDHNMQIYSKNLGKYYSTPESLFNHATPNSITRAIIFGEAVDVIDPRYAGNAEVNAGFNTWLGDVSSKQDLALNLVNTRAIMDANNSSLVADLKTRFPNVITTTEGGEISYKLDPDYMKDLVIERLVNPDQISTGTASATDVGNFKYFKELGVTSLDDFDKLITDQFGTSEINLRLLDKTLTPDQIKTLGEFNVFTVDSNGKSTLKTSNVLQSVIEMSKEIADPNTSPEVRAKLQDTVNSLTQPTDKIPQKVIPRIGEGDIEVKPQSPLDFLIFNADESINNKVLNGMMENVSELVKTELDTTIKNLDTDVYMKLLQEDKTRTQTVGKIKNEYSNIISEFENSKNKNQLLQDQKFQNKVNKLIETAKEVDPEVVSILGLDQLQQLQPEVYKGKVTTGLETLSAINNIPENLIKGMEVNVNSVKNIQPILGDMLKKLSRNKDTKKYVTTAKFKKDLQHIMDNMSVMEDAGIDTSKLQKLIDFDYSNFSSKGDKGVLLDTLKSLSSGIDEVGKMNSDKLRAVSNLKSSLTKTGNVKNTLKAKKTIDDLGLIRDLLSENTTKYSYDDITDYIKYISGGYDDDFNSKFTGSDIWVDSKRTLGVLDEVLNPRSKESLNIKLSALREMQNIYKEMQNRVGKISDNASTMLKNISYDDYKQRLVELNKILGSPYNDEELISSKYYNFAKGLFDDVKQKVTENPLTAWTKNQKKRVVKVSGETQAKLDRLNQFMSKKRWLREFEMFKQDVASKESIIAAVNNIDPSTIKDGKGIFVNLAVDLDDMGLRKAINDIYDNPNVPLKQQSEIMNGTFEKYVEPQYQERFKVVYNELGQYAKKVPIEFDKNNMPTAFRNMTLDEFTLWYHDTLNTLSKTRNISNNIARFEGKETFYLKDLIPYFEDSDSMLRFFTDYVDGREGYLLTNELALHSSLNKNCRVIGERYAFGTSLSGLSHTLRNIKGDDLSSSLVNNKEKFKVYGIDKEAELVDDIYIINKGIANIIDRSIMNTNDQNIFASSFRQLNPQTFLSSFVTALQANILTGVGFAEALGKDIAVGFNINQPTYGKRYGQSYVRYTATQTASRFKGIAKGMASSPAVGVGMAQAAADNIGMFAKILNVDKVVKNLTGKDINLRPFKEFDVTTKWDSIIYPESKIEAKFVSNALKSLQMTEYLNSRYRHQGMNEFSTGLYENANLVQISNNTKAYILSHTHTSKLLAKMANVSYDLVDNRDRAALARAGVTADNFPELQNTIKSLQNPDGSFKADIVNLGSTFLNDYTGDIRPYQTLGDVTMQIFNRGFKENPDIDITPTNTKDVLTKAVTSFTQTTGGAGKELWNRFFFDYDESGLRMSRWKNFKEANYSEKFNRTFQTVVDANSLLLPMAVAGTAGGVIQTAFKNFNNLNREIAKNYGDYKTVGQILTGNEAADEETYKNLWYVYKTLGESSAKQFSAFYFLNEGKNIFENIAEEGIKPLQHLKLELAQQGIDIEKLNSLIPLTQDITAQQAMAASKHQLALFLFSMASTFPVFAPAAITKPIYEKVTDPRYATPISQMQRESKVLSKTSTTELQDFNRQQALASLYLQSPEQENLSSDFMQLDKMDWETSKKWINATQEYFTGLIEAEKEMVATGAYYTFNGVNQELLDNGYIDQKEYDDRLNTAFEGLGVKEKYENLSPSYRYVVDDVMDTKSYLDLSTTEKNEIMFEILADIDNGLSPAQVRVKYTDPEGLEIEENGKNNIQEKKEVEDVKDLSFSYQLLWEELVEKNPEMDKNAFINLYKDGKSPAQIRKTYE
jgi:hypothetical protein